MRRARYLAGDDASLETNSAPDCLCGPAIPTQKCAPARHAGKSTKDCMDPQAFLIVCRRRLSHRRKGSDIIQSRRHTWRRRERNDPRLERQGKANFRSPLAPRVKCLSAHWFVHLGAALFRHPPRCIECRPCRICLFFQCQKRWRPQGIPAEIAPLARHSKHFCAARL
jgi:hypothetical protein